MVESTDQPLLKPICRQIRNWIGYIAGSAHLSDRVEAPSTSFPKLRTYRSEREIEFVAPPMDDRVAIEITDKFDDALLQFVCRVDTDVAEHGARCFGEKTLDEVEPGTVFGGEHKGEAAVR